MDWENERYVRLYTRDTVDDAVLSWEADALWTKLMRKFDRAGVLPMSRHGWKGVAALTRMPLDVVEVAIEELLTDGRIELRGDWLFAPNFMAAQECKQSDKQRSSESRARRRERAKAAERGLLPYSRDTNRDSETRNVSESHDVSHAVTPSLAVLSLADVSVPASQEPLTRPASGSEKPKRKKASKPKVPRWTGAKIRSDAETQQWTDRRFGEFAGDFVELCARLADSREGGVAQTVLERFTGQLVELAGENFAAFRYGVEQILELDDGFEFSGRPVKIVNYIKTCMKSHRPNGAASRNPGRANSRGDLNSAAIQQLALTARETDGQ